MIKAKYTVVLKTLLDEPETARMIEKALSTYPLYEKKSVEEFQPSFIPTREELNRKLLNHFKYREIGFETVGRFVDELEITMNEIMPYYNQLFFSADQDYNILFNVDYSRSIERDLDGSGTDKNKTDSESNSSGTSNALSKDTITTTDTSDNNNKQVNSKTPQSEISIAATNIDSVSYADDVTWNKANNSASGTSNNSGESNTSNSATSKDSTSFDAERTNKEKEKTLEKTFGNFGVVSSQDLIEKYRNLILNIEQQIFEDENITNLFMNIF